MRYLLCPVCSCGAEAETLQAVTLRDSYIAKEDEAQPLSWDRNPAPHGWTKSLWIL